jgi:hypothetical protein
MASITGRARWAIEIGRTIIWNPPVCACFDVVRNPLLLGDVPLRRKREIVISPFGEIPLLVTAAVNQSDVI